MKVIGPCLSDSDQINIFIVKLIDIIKVMNNFILNSHCGDYYMENKKQFYIHDHLPAVRSETAKKSFYYCYCWTSRFPAGFPAQAFWF